MGPSALRNIIRSSSQRDLLIDNKPTYFDSFLRVFDYELGTMMSYEGLYSPRNLVDDADLASQVRNFGHSATQDELGLMQ